MVNPHYYIPIFTICLNLVFLATELLTGAAFAEPRPDLPLTRFEPPITDILKVRVYDKIFMEGYGV